MRREIYHQASLCTTGANTPEVSGDQPLPFRVEEETKRLAGEHGTVTVPQPETTLAQPKAAPSTSSVGQKERAKPKDVQPVSQSIMVPSIGFPEQCPTIRLVGTKPPFIKIPPSSVSSPPSNEEVDYSGDDFNFGDKPPPPDTSKFSHLTIEEIEVTSLTETVLPPAEIASTEDKL